MERKARRAKRFGLQSKHKDAEKTSSQSDEDTDPMYVQTERITGYLIITRMIVKRYKLIIVSIWCENAH